MVEGELQNVVAQPKIHKDVKVVQQSNSKSTLELHSKVGGPWYDEIEHRHVQDSKSPIRSLDTDDCTSVNVHVLVVDDNFVDRKIVERLVKAASFTVTAVDSGAKALEAISSNSHINLVITDYCMPEMCGYELLKHLKGATASKDIPVVIMSSENVPKRIQSCLEEGAEEFLLKPVRLADVKRLRTYVLASKGSALEQHSLPCKKRKFTTEEFQVQSPERGPRLGSVTVA